MMSIDKEIGEISSLLGDALVFLELSRAVGEAGRIGRADTHGVCGCYDYVASGRDAKEISRRVRNAVPDAAVSRVSDSMVGISLKGGRRGC